MRQVLVHQEDQGKAERLLAEMTPVRETPEEYHGVGVGSKRRHLLSLLAEYFGVQAKA
jgi:hypothetical protein